MNLSEFLDNQSTLNYRLDEGAKEILGKITSGISTFFKGLLPKLKSAISHFVGNVGNILVKKVGNSNIPIYQTNSGDHTEVGYIYPDMVVKSQQNKFNQGSKSATFAKVFIPNDGKKSIKVVFDTKFEENSSKSNQLTRSVNESLKYNSKNYIKEDLDAPVTDDAYDIDKQKANAFKELDVVTNKFDDVGFNAENEPMDPALDRYLSSCELSTGTLATIVQELYNGLELRLSQDESIQSLLLLGRPGVGKTALINALRGKDIKIHIVEIATVIKELLAGVPVPQQKYETFENFNALPEDVKAKIAQNAAKVRSMGKEKITANTYDIEAVDPAVAGTIDSSDLIQGENGTFTRKTIQVSMVAADMFPLEDGKNHIFFFDEFNRDKEKMGAAMNLMLSGSIGNQYKLPRKTFVVASGNLGTGIDGVNVQQLDSATFDRFSIKGALGTDFGRSGKYDQMKANKMPGDDPNAPWYDQRQYDLIKKENPKYVSAQEIMKIPVDVVHNYRQDWTDLTGAVSGIEIFRYDSMRKFGIGIDKDDNTYGKALTQIGLNAIHKQYPSEDEGDNVDGYGGDTDGYGEPIAKYRLTARTLSRMNERLKTLAFQDWVRASENEKAIKAGKEVPEWTLKADNLSQFPDHRDWLAGQPSLVPHNFRGLSKKYMNCRTPSDWIAMYNKEKTFNEERGVFGPAALYLQIMQWSKYFLPYVVKTTAGANPIELFNRMTASYNESLQEMNTTTIHDILFGYSVKRKVGHIITAGKSVRNLSGKEFQEHCRNASSLPFRVMDSIIEYIIKYDTPAKIMKQVEAVTGCKSIDEVSKVCSEGKSIQIDKNGNKSIIGNDGKVLIKGISGGEAPGAGGPTSESMLYEAGKKDTNTFTDKQGRVLQTLDTPELGGAEARVVGLLCSNIRLFITDSDGGIEATHLANFIMQCMRVGLYPDEKDNLSLQKGEKIKVSDNVRDIILSIYSHLIKKNKDIMVTAGLQAGANFEQMETQEQVEIPESRNKLLNNDSLLIETGLRTLLRKIR
jgi:hypothetical protein